MHKSVHKLYEIVKYVYKKCRRSKQEVYNKGTGSVQKVYKKVFKKGYKKYTKSVKYMYYYVYKK